MLSQDDGGLGEARATSLEAELHIRAAEFRGLTTAGLMGLADRCSSPGKGADAIPASEHEWVCEAVNNTLRVGWSIHHPNKRELSATVHRTSWALLERASSATHGAADIARVAEEMHEFPHSLLSLRSSGVLWSKGNRYVPSWLTFSELRQRLSHYESEYIGKAAAGEAVGGVRQRTIHGFHEVQQQALLAETGTAARTVENLLVEWVPEMQELPERWRRLRYNEAFNTLQRGVLTGSLAADEVPKLDTAGPKTVEKAAIDSWVRRPGVMTARCHLELFVLARVVQTFNARTAPPVVAPDGATAAAPSWDEFVLAQWQAFLRHYREAHTSQIIQFDAEHVRELVQLRLFAAMLSPAESIEPVETRSGDQVSIPACLAHERPTRDELAEWLLDGRHNANIALSVTAPEFLAMMHMISGSESLLAWMRSPDRDLLRRGAVQTGGLSQAQRANYERGWREAERLIAELSTLP